MSKENIEDGSLTPIRHVNEQERIFGIFIGNA